MQGTAFGYIDSRRPGIVPLYRRNDTSENATGTDAGKGDLLCEALLTLSMADEQLRKVLRMIRGAGGVSEEGA